MLHQLVLNGVFFRQGNIIVVSGVRDVGDSWPWCGGGLTLTAVAGRRWRRLSGTAPQLWQHAGRDQFLVDLIVYAAELFQNVLVEQLVNDDQHRQFDVKLVRRDLETHGQVEWSQRVLLIAGGLAPLYCPQALAQRVQRAGQPVLTLGGHLGNGQRFLKLLFVHQGQIIFGHCLLALALAQRLTFAECLERFFELLLKSLLRVAALAAYFPHAIEVVGLLRVVLRLFRHVEQGVIHRLEEGLEQRRQAFANGPDAA